MPDEILKRRAIEYAELSGNTLDLATPLGHGTDGSVWKTRKKTAVKALELHKNYNSETTLAEWEEDCKEKFGSRWGAVQTLIWSLEQYGIYYYDAKPANISFGDDSPD